MKFLDVANVNFRARGPVSDSSETFLLRCNHRSRWRIYHRNSVWVATLKKGYARNENYVSSLSFGRSVG